MLTPEERAKIEKEDEELIQRWSAELSEGELLVRLQTYGDAMGANADTIGVEIAGLKALVWMMQHCHKSPLESVRMLCNKKTRTMEETAALYAWKQYLLQSASRPTS